MKPIIAILLPVCALASVAMAAPCAVVFPHAKIETGGVTGKIDGQAEAFLGIPYAAPPVGDLRWRAPQPAPAWQGNFKADTYGHDCMQEPFPSDAAPLGMPPAEDCLVMNVWRPAGAVPGAHLPVLVWIYGGGHVNGGSSPAVYSGEPFARDGVIFVSFNYRVGRFGFFGFPELTRLDADKGQLANYGYMDSIAALKWVRNNIAAFGGNPGQVTIYGQSAGASQVAMLMTSPEAKGLFARAIIQSGGAMARPKFHDAAPGGVTLEQAGVNFARRWGIEGTGAEALAKLRALSPQQVTDGIHIGTAASQKETFGGAVIDGVLLTDALTDAAEAAREAKVPLLIGSTTADNTTSMQARTLDEAFSTTFAKVSAQAKAAYLADPKADPQYVLREMGRDLGYAESNRFIATQMTHQGLPVYMYRFGYVAEIMKPEWPEGPPHATDIPYTMGTMAAKYRDKLSPTDVDVERDMHAYWVNFVRTGNPNAPGLPQWPVYQTKVDVILDVRPTGKIEAVPDPRHDRLDAVAATRGH